MEFGGSFFESLFQEELVCEDLHVEDGNRALFRPIVAEDDMDLPQLSQSDCPKKLRCEELTHQGSPDEELPRPTKRHRDDVDQDTDTKMHDATIPDYDVVLGINQNATTGKRIWDSVRRPYAKKTIKTSKLQDLKADLRCRLEQTLGYSLPRDPIFWYSASNTKKLTPHSKERRALRSGSKSVFGIATDEAIKQDIRNAPKRDRSRTGKAFNLKGSPQEVLIQVQDELQAWIGKDLTKELVAAGFKEDLDRLKNMRQEHNTKQTQCEHKAQAEAEPHIQKLHDYEARVHAFRAKKLDERFAALVNQSANDMVECYHFLMKMPAGSTSRTESSSNGHSGGASGDGRDSSDGNRDSASNGRSSIGSESPGSSHSASGFSSHDRSYSGTNHPMYGYSVSPGLASLGMADSQSSPSSQGDFTASTCPLTDSLSSSEDQDDDDDDDDFDQSCERIVLHGQCHGVVGANATQGISDMIDSLTVAHLKVLLRLEAESYPPCKDYLAAIASTGANNSETINEAWRQKLCEWFFVVVDHFQLDREIASIAVNYLDRAIAYEAESSSDIITKRDFQLMSVTTIYMAIKIHGSSAHKIDTFVELGRGYFQVENIEAMERTILSSLHWHLNPPTKLRFVASLMALCPKWLILAHGPAYQSVLWSIYEIARYLSELSEFTPMFVFKHKSSTIAYSAILFAIEALQGTLPLPDHVRVAFLNDLGEVTGLFPEMEEVRQVHESFKQLHPSKFRNGQRSPAFIVEIIKQTRPSKISQHSPACIVDGTDSGTDSSSSFLNDYSSSFLNNCAVLPGESICTIGDFQEKMEESEGMDAHSMEWDTELATTRSKQRCLLLLYHTSRCHCEAGRCPVTPHCSTMKHLWEHIKHCTSLDCTEQYCLSSRSALKHYQRCNDIDCFVCKPVRIYMQQRKDGENSWRVKLTGRQEAGGCCDAQTASCELARRIPSEDESVSSMDL